MKKNNPMMQWSEIVKQLSLLSQLGLSLMTPLLLCLGICYLLTAKAGLGGWVYIFGFFFGLGGSATFAYKVYLSVMHEEGKKDKKTKREKKVFYNRHE